MLTKEQFEKLFRELYPDLLRYAFALTGDIYSAEEIVQEVFIALWNAEEKNTSIISYDKYLYTAVKYRSVNFIKRQLPKIRRQTDLDLNLTTHEVTSDSKDMHNLIRMAINSLPDQCKRIFLLSRFTNLTYKEIAAHLDVSIKTVESQMNISLKKIRQFLIQKGLLQ